MKVSFSQPPENGGLDFNVLIETDEITELYCDDYQISASGCQITLLKITGPSYSEVK